MRILFRSKDGGQESRVWGYWLIEWKRAFSVVLLCFEDGTRDAFHSHAFNSVSWVLWGGLGEQLKECPKSTWFYWPSLRPVYTYRDTFHKVTRTHTHPRQDRSMTNLGRLVKWQEAGGGWHTGREVMNPPDSMYGGMAVEVVIEREEYSLYPSTLVRESCGGELTWVLTDLLTDWETREQRAARGEE